jgi:hypothetical protein
MPFMMRARITGAALVLATLTSFGARDALADCAQPPVFVPGLSGGPVWLPTTAWVPPGAPSWRAQLNDPRWAGGPVQFFQFQSGGGFADQYDAQYRIVYQSGHLWVSIQTRIDPDGIDGSDAVYVGITQPGTSVAHLFAIQPDGTSPVSDPTGMVPHDPAFPSTNSAASIAYFKTLDTAVSTAWCELYPVSNPATGTGPCAAALPAPPAWLQNVATWTNSPGLDTGGWAVTLQIDTAAIGASGQPVQLVLGSRVRLSSTPTTILNLTSAAQTGTLIGTTPIPAAVTTGWTSYDPLGNSCPAGISVSANTVGVWDSATSTLTNAVNTYPSATIPCPTCTNQFRVNVQNVPLAGSAGHPGAFAVRSRIRVAEWGSTIADPNAPWNDFGIPADVFAQPQTYFAAAGSGWAWSQSGSDATIDYTCTVQSGNRYCPFLAATQRHQCMLVELGVDPNATASGAPGWNLRTAAVYRNMEFGSASTLSEPATISIKGLQKLTGAPADRDVYLYVETRNMPPHGPKAFELSQRDLAAARQYAMQPPPIPRNDDARKNRSAPPAPSATPLDLPLLTGDQALTEVYPTYRVFPYYDSGKTVTVNGAVEKVLVPMVPFGFYVNHTGALFGFNTSIAFLDATAKQIAPNFYVIRVANEGQFHVQTTITAEDRPAGEGPPPVPHQCRCNCDAVGTSPWSPLSTAVAVLGAAALGIRIRRRRAKR